MTTLTRKQTAFVNAYFECNLNATRAAKTLGYRDPGQDGWRLSNHPKVSVAIKERMQQHAMSADEALFRLGAMARADMTDFLTVTKGHHHLDLVAAKEAGRLGLIRRYGNSERDGVEIELHDAQSALDKILRVHGAYKEQQQTGEALTMLRTALGVTDGDAEKP